MSVVSTNVYTIHALGGTFAINPLNSPDVIILKPSSNNLNLIGNVAFTLSSTPEVGWSIKFIIYENWNVGGNTFTIFGNTITNLPSTGAVQSPQGVEFIQDTAGLDFFAYPLSVQDNVIKGTNILDESMPIGKITQNTTNKLLTWDNNTDPTSVLMSGDATFAYTGVLTIANGVITNAKVASGAAIAVNKLAALTASEVVTTDGSGFIQSSATLSTLLGGLGLNASSSTGFVTMNSGTTNIGTMSQTIISDVDFTNPPSGISTNKIKMSFAGTVTGIYAIVTNTISGTDSATIIPKNNAGTSMTLSSPITFNANSAVDTALDVGVTSNNSFVVGDILQFVTNKPTIGGKVKLSITVTRSS